MTNALSYPPAIEPTPAPEVGEESRLPRRQGIVKSLRAHMNGEYFLTLEGGHELKLSRTYRDKVEYFLKRPRAH